MVSIGEWKAPFHCQAGRETGILHGEANRGERRVEPGDKSQSQSLILPLTGSLFIGLGRRESKSCRKRER